MEFGYFTLSDNHYPNNARSANQLVLEIREQAILADTIGMHSAWIGEHHGMEFTIAPNPFINLAYLGARTERIRLGTGTVIAPFWHPIRLAGEAAMTDLATKGRLDLGIARGALDAWGAPSDDVALVPFAEPGACLLRLGAQRSGA